jgi:hypothetical protein
MNRAPEPACPDCGGYCDSRELCDALRLEARHKASASTEIRIPRDADCSNAAFHNPNFRSAFTFARKAWGCNGYLGSDGARWYFQKLGDPTPYSVEVVP